MTIHALTVVSLEIVEETGTEQVVAQPLVMTHRSGHIQAITFTAPRGTHRLGDRVEVRLGGTT